MRDLIDGIAETGAIEIAAAMAVALSFVGVVSAFMRDLIRPLLTNWVRTPPQYGVDNLGQNLLIDLLPSAATFVVVTAAAIVVVGLHIRRLGEGRTGGGRPRIRMRRRGRL